MIEMSPKEIASNLTKLQAICSQVASRIENMGGRVTGFSPELARLRTHLETYHSLDKTRRMTSRLRTTRDLGNRSKKTRDYVELAIDTFEKLAGDTKDFGVVLWRFGWLARLLRSETRSGRPQRNKGTRDRQRSGRGR